jgi:hypothetical protein
MGDLTWPYSGRCSKNISEQVASVVLRQGQGRERSRRAVPSETCLPQARSRDKTSPHCILRARKNEFYGDPFRGSNKPLEAMEEEVLRKGKVRPSGRNRV